MNNFLIINCQSANSPKLEVQRKPRDLGENSIRVVYTELETLSFQVFRNEWFCSQFLQLVRTTPTWQNEFSSIKNTIIICKTTISESRSQIQGTSLLSPFHMQRRGNRKRNFRPPAMQGVQVTVNPRSVLGQTARCTISRFVSKLFGLAQFLWQ